jgi:ABC-type transport system involved in multi-copper enzyme maturation permease subunit
MTPCCSFLALKLLTRDTFRQAWASGISWLLLAVTGVCVLLCLSVRVRGDVRLDADDEPGFFLPPPTAADFAPSVVAALGVRGPLGAAALTTAAGRKVWFSKNYNRELARREGVETVSGRLTLGFGVVSVPVPRDRGDAVHFLELVLGEGVAGVLGVLLALVWTAGFVPAFLDPAAASVLLAKPVPRWLLLAGKYVGVLAFLGAQAVLFVAGTWLALGVRTHVWDVTYWWAVPLLLLQFAVFYSFSLLLAVATRSTAACVVGSVLFWLLAWGVNYGCVMARSQPGREALPGVTPALVEGAYWISPKPIDAGLMLFNALDARQHFEKPVIFRLLESGQAFSAAGSVLSSVLIVVVLLALSGYELHARDY